MILFEKEDYSITWRESGGNDDQKEVESRIKDGRRLEIGALGEEMMLDFSLGGIHRIH